MIISDYNDCMDVVEPGAMAPIMRFYLDHRDGFYKCPFNSVSTSYSSVHKNILIKPEKDWGEKKLEMFINEHIERAERAHNVH